MHPVDIESRLNSRGHAGSVGVRIGASARKSQQVLRDHAAVTAGLVRYDLQRIGFQCTPRRVLIAAACKRRYRCGVSYLGWVRKELARRDGPDIVLVRVAGNRLVL